MPARPFRITQPVRPRLSDPPRVSRLLDVLPVLAAGGPGACRSSVRAPERRPAAPLAPPQEDRSLLVSSRRGPLPRPRGRSDRRARMVLDRHACGLRSTPRLRRSRSAVTRHSAAPAKGAPEELVVVGVWHHRVRLEGVTSVPAEQDDQSARREGSDLGGCLIAEWSAVVGGRSGSCRGCRRSGDPHAQKVGGAVEPEHDPDDEGHETPAPIDEQLRLDEANVPSARAEGAAAGRHDVLHPLDVGAVGQQEDVPVAASEDVDQRAVCPTALPYPVLSDPKHVGQLANRRAIGLKTCVVNGRMARIRVGGAVLVASSSRCHSPALAGHCSGASSNVFIQTARRPGRFRRDLDRRPTEGPLHHAHRLPILPALYRELLRRLRIHPVWTPTEVSWLNAIEAHFGVLKRAP